jgi:hypothetical protein
MNLYIDFMEIDCYNHTVKIPIIAISIPEKEIPMITTKVMF